MCQRLLRAALSAAVAATAATAQEAPVDTIPWTPQNQLTITAPVRLDGMRGDTIRLTYSVESHPASVQAGETVFLRRNTRIWVVGSPSGWVGDTTLLVQDSAAVIWLTFEARTRIKAGESITGFAVAGIGVPDLVTLRVLGYVPAPVGDESADIELADPPSVWVDAAEALTVGIVPQPVATSAAMLDRLSTLSSRACELAWVSAPICSSLSSRLSVATAALAKGQNGTARSAIDAYVSDLEARRAGEVSESAYALLWPNAKGLRARL
jgi:hypothetical protein